jgi:hypothetical protein
LVSGMNTSVPRCFCFVNFDKLFVIFCLPRVNVRKFSLSDRNIFVSKFYDSVNITELPVNVTKYLVPETDCMHKFTNPWFSITKMRQKITEAKRTV